MSAELPHPLSPRFEAERERTVEALCAHFAHDHLTDLELEARLDLAHAAASHAELDALLADLPALAAPTAPGAVPLPSGVGLARPDEVRTQETVFALMGNSARKGAWTPARVLDVVSVMSEVQLDFREARFAPGTTELRAFALMASVKITVPPGVRVESSGIGVMGAFESHDAGEVPAGAPVLRITGLALMGSVEIRSRLPGESASEARRRLRAERKAQRRLERGR